ncbi:PREDICTED: tripartite motif-containing protein 43-like [Elephantulus edwardii]|uniref:tripartite motif-containing protein 43-like n=1 Tax=Elephantulus edwardii TaxID=28737 RepID=UPI0003F0C0BC|nr:PREDICTED: tripartite motif-containing protein 43-like [Elephantulus edwardii]
MMIHGEYKKVHPGLHEIKTMQLGLLSDHRKFIEDQFQETEHAMLKKHKELHTIYEELLNMCYKPDVEMLQELGDLLFRSKSVQLRMPVPVNPVYHAIPIPGLMSRCNKFRVKISFHNEISNHDIMMFKNVQSLKLGCDLQDTYFSPGRSKYFAAWGITGLQTSVKQYWEVDVDKSLDWAVGMCRRGPSLMNGPAILKKGVFLLLHQKENNFNTLLTTSPPTFLYSEKPLERVGVHVDFDCGSVSFVNVAKSSLIWRYPDNSFRCPLTPFYCTEHTLS